MSRGALSIVLTFAIKFEFALKLSSLSLSIYIYIKRVREGQVQVRLSCFSETRETKILHLKFHSKTL